MSLRDRLRSADWYRISAIVLLLWIGWEAHGARSEAEDASQAASQAAEAAQLCHR